MELVHVTNKETWGKIKQSKGLDPTKSVDNKTHLTTKYNLQGKESATSLEKVLYNERLQPLKRGWFTKGGRVILKIKRPLNSIEYKGITNKTNGVHEWRTSDFIPLEDIEVMLED
jgi:hypothetical protein